MGRVGTFRAGGGTVLLLNPLTTVAALGAAALLRLRRALFARFFFQLEAFLATQIAAVLKHVPGIGMKCPVGALAGLVGGTCHFDEAIVEGQRVADGVLPALLVLAVVREQIHDPLVDFVERQHLAVGLLDGHRDEGYVGVRWLGMGQRASVRLGHLLSPVERGRRGVADLGHWLTHALVMREGTQGGGRRAQLSQRTVVQRGADRGQAHVAGASTHATQWAAVETCAGIAHIHAGCGTGRVQIYIAVQAAH